jgi:hypothetical protein
MPLSSVIITIAVTKGLSRRGVPAGTFIPAVSTSQPHFGQMQPPSIQWRFVFLNGDINLGSSRPQSGQGGGRFKNSNITKKKMKGAQPARAKNSVSFISGSNILFGDYIFVFH